MVPLAAAVSSYAAMLSTAHMARNGGGPSPTRNTRKDETPRAEIIT